MSRAIALPWCYETVLSPLAPFHFDSTVHKPDYYPSSDNAYEPGRYWQTMRLGGRVMGITLANEGTVDQPRVRLSVYAAEEIPCAALQAVEREIEFRTDMQVDLSAFYSRYADDPLLGPLLVRWRGMRVSTYVSLYEYLVVATVLQNATVRRTVQMSENLFRRYGSRVVFDGRELSAFWDPEAIAATSEEELRALKVGYRAKHLKRQAEPFVRGEIDEPELRALPDAELRKVLTSLYGIGPASAMYLMFGQFKRYDVFDHLPPWEQKIYSQLLFDRDLVPAPAILEEIRSRWGEWRGLAAHYIWEDLFWRHRQEPIPWLAALIRL